MSEALFGKQKSMRCLAANNCRLQDVSHLLHPRHFSEPFQARGPSANIQSDFPTHPQPALKQEAGCKTVKSLIRPRQSSKFILLLLKKDTVSPGLPSPQIQKSEHQHVEPYREKG